MGQRFRFAIVSDPHIARPETIYNGPHRFHLVEVSIPGIEQIFDHLETLNLDFLLLPGDLTQHGEWVNHQWLIDRLKRLPFPAYVVPGNHDVIARDATDRAIGLHDFPRLYRDFGYSDGQTLHYQQEVLPGVRLVALNSNAFKPCGEQIGVGYVDEAQLDWLEAALAEFSNDLILVMLHHNVLEHLPGQSQSPLGQRYMVSNAEEIIRRLEAAQVRLMFTGHLHVQDVARRGDLCEVLTGSLVSYPHPYRIVEIDHGEGELRMEVRSRRLTAVGPWDDLQAMSHQWMCDRASGFMTRFLTSPPIGLEQAVAAAIAPQLRHFWAAIAAGDTQMDFSHLPPAVQERLACYNAPQAIDNSATLVWPAA